MTRQAEEPADSAGRRAVPPDDETRWPTWDDIARLHRIQVPAVGQLADNSRQGVTPGDHPGSEPDHQPFADLRRHTGQFAQHHRSPG